MSFRKPLPTTHQPPTHNAETCLHVHAPNHCCVRASFMSDMRSPDGCTPSPYEVAAAQRKRDAAAAVDAEGFSQGWRWQDSKAKRHRSVRVFTVCACMYIECLCTYVCVRMCRDMVLVNQVSQSTFLSVDYMQNSLGSCNIAGNVCVKRVQYTWEPKSIVLTQGDTSGGRLRNPGVVVDNRKSVLMRNLPFKAVDDDIVAFFAGVGAVVDIRRGEHEGGCLTLHFGCFSLPFDVLCYVFFLLVGPVCLSCLCWFHGHATPGNTVHCQGCCSSGCAWVDCMHRAPLHLVHLAVDSC